MRTLYRICVFYLTAQQMAVQQTPLPPPASIPQLPPPSSLPRIPSTTTITQLPPPDSIVSPAELPHAGSPLNVAHTFPQSGTYILHPPLPSLTPGKDAPSVPILINPNIIQQAGVTAINVQVCIPC